MFTSSPGLIAGFHVLHRLLTPRHPPHALVRLITPTSDRSPSTLGFRLAAVRLQSNTTCRQSAGSAAPPYGHSNPDKSGQAPQCSTRLTRFMQHNASTVIHLHLSKNLSHRRARRPDRTPPVTRPDAVVGDTATDAERSIITVACCLSTRHAQTQRSAPSVDPRRLMLSRNNTQRRSRRTS